MHYLLMNPTLDLKIQILQSLPGHYPGKIPGQWTFSLDHVEMKQISASNSSLKVIEIRLNDATLTYHYEEGCPCHVSYLFPDYDEDIQEYIRFFNQHYQSIENGLWLNQENQILIQVTDDEDVGYMISCSKAPLA